MKFQEKVSVKKVTNILPSVINNESEYPEIQEFNLGNIGDGNLQFQPV